MAYFLKGRQTVIKEIPLSFLNNEMSHMTALRLSLLFANSAKEDVNRMAKKLGMNKAEAADILARLTSLAEAQPSFTLRTQKDFSEMYKRAVSLKVKVNKVDMGNTKPLVKVIDRLKESFRIDVGYKNNLSSEVPTIFFGGRGDLDENINYILDRLASQKICVMHLSGKSSNRTINKNYVRYKPSDWVGRVKCKRSFSEFLSKASKLRPVEVVVVDEIADCYARSAPDGFSSWGRLEDAFHSFDYCKSTTRPRNIVLLAFHVRKGMHESTNSDKTMDKFFSVANPITCSSENGIIHLADRCQRVFSLKKES
jgi:hypothetical protein